jgi:hypothetical protein
MMCSAIDNPANCEIRAVIHFLQVKISATEIHSGLCSICGRNIMSVEPVRQ